MAVDGTQPAFGSPGDDGTTIRVYVATELFKAMVTAAPNSFLSSTEAAAIRADYIALAWDLTDEFLLAG